MSFSIIEFDLVGKSTFNWWVTYEYKSEVRLLNKDDLGSYESNYVRCWNYVRDRGWEKIDNFWISPDGRVKYKTVYEAYNSQKYKEMIEKKVSCRS